MGFYSWGDLRPNQRPGQGANSGLARWGMGSLSDQQIKTVEWDPVKLSGLVQMKTIRDGNAGTADTIGIMTDLAYKASQDPQFVMIAQSVVQGIASKDYQNEANSIYNYVDANVRFRNDPRSLEWISAPYYLLMVRGEEDCESIACLITALGLSINLGAAYVTYKCDPSRPNEWTHVAAALGWRGPDGVKWALCDTTYQGNDRGFGWTPPPSKYWDKKIWVIAEP